MSSGGTKKTENLAADVVIIGGGGAGLTAAVAAAERGISIVLLEARNAPSGNAVFASGLFTVGSHFEKDLDIVSARDDFLKKAMNYTRWKTNPRLIRALIEKSPDTLEWLEEKGLQFKGMQMGPGMILPFYVGPEKMAGAGVVKVMIKKCEELGVQTLCNTRGRKLLTDDKGKVIGVLAEAKDKNFEIDSKSAVIATGGFAGNKELLKKYVPSYSDDVYLGGLPHQGDGLLMATEIGAATDGIVILEMEGPVFPWSSDLTEIVHRANMLWVNKKGERFMDETVMIIEAANNLLRQPGKISYTVFDEDIKQGIFKEEFSPMMARMVGDRAEWTAAVDKGLQLQAEKGRVKVSDSWDDIAKWIGAAPEVLKATIDEYNSFCDKGHDDLFAKDKKYLVPLRTPPYYAIQCCVRLLVTHGDIKVNQNMEVLDNQDDPVPGLYAAGVDIGGTDADTYNTTLPGHSFGFTVNSGRIAGENAALFALEG